MAKKRKTRAQKKSSDFRHNFSHTILNQAAITTQNKLQLETASIPMQKKIVNSNTTAYPYLMKDLSKTAILTFTILAFQIALYFLLTNHMFKIPGVSY